MKQNIQKLPILLVLLFASCATTLPGNDPVLVNAERVTSLAYTTFDSFFALERQQEVYVKANLPQVHAYANSLRSTPTKQGLANKYLVSARAATEAYRLNRSSDNEFTLTTAIAILQVALDQVGNYTTQIVAKAP